MKLMKHTLAIVLLFTIAVAQAPLAKKTWITLAPVAPVNVSPGKATNAEVKFTITKGYHVNSNKPTAEFLIPTTLSLKPSNELSMGKVAYPPGHDFALSFDPKQKLNVYTGDVALNVPIIAGKTAKRGTYKLAGELEYQACNDYSCFPPRKAPVEITVVVR